MLEPGGSDRTIVEDGVLTTGQVSKAMSDGLMVNQSIKSDERRINS